MSESAACRENAARETSEDWQRAHGELERLARSRAGLDFEEGRWLLAAWRGGVHVRLGYGSFREYIERLFGYGPRLVQDKLRVAEALEGLPALAGALQTGHACWSVLRELTRVATSETEGEWLSVAAGRTVREVEQLVSGHALGSRPNDPCDSAARRHLLRFEVSGEVLASMREALAKIRRDAGEPLDDDAALLLMARAVLAGPSDEGRSSYQVALTVCERCRRGALQGNGELVEVGLGVVEMAACDAQHIGHTDSASAHAGVLLDLRGVQAGAGTPAVQVGAHVGARPVPVNAHVGAKLPRAVQSIPPAIRRLVLRRDHGRCVVPGCRHAIHVDAHHLVTRAEGGQHDPDQLVTLCGAHHRAVHRGALVIEGTVGAGLTFRHADGSPYGTAVSTAGADAGAKAFQALRNLGFGESEVRRALSHVQRLGALANVEVLVRHSLLLLTERRAWAR